MLETISKVLENKINETCNNNEKREALISKIVAYNDGNINAYLDNGENNKRLLLNRWYHQSYPIFVKNAKRFVTCKENDQKKELLTNLVTNTMSWIAGIPKSSIHDRQLITAIHDVSSASSNKNYNTCSINVSSKKIITLACKDGNNLNISEFVQLTNKLINSNEQFNNFPTVTKLMHFFNPNIFPIFDTNVRNVLFGNKKTQPTGKQFTYYIQALCNIHQDSQYDKLLSSLTDEVNTALRSKNHYCELTSLRVIDLMLFDESMD